VSGKFPSPPAALERDWRLTGANLFVSDPIQVGVMTEMAVADTAKFEIVRQARRR